MKENKCKMTFECENEDCVYMRGEKYCDYTNGKECNNTIAMVNKMVLKLKELGLEGCYRALEDLLDFKEENDGNA